MIKHVHSKSKTKIIQTYFILYLDWDIQCSATYKFENKIIPSDHLLRFLKKSIVRELNNDRLDR
jgi:hypothetical protein